MMNQRPPVMSMRKTVQLMVILTLLAWATQTLFAQWGLGGLILPERPGSVAPPPASAPPARVPDRPGSGPTIELRSSAHFIGDEKVTLRDLCRWADDDAAVMEPLAGVLIANLGGPVKVRQVTVDDIKSRLHDAGANLSQLHFTGSATCAILVGDAKESDVAAAQLQAADPFETASAEPILLAGAPATQPAPEEAVIFEDQLVLTRPLTRGQPIIAGDIEEKRVQVDEPSDRPAMTKDDIIGNLAARDLEAGDVIDADDVKSPPVVTAGQFITVAMNVAGFDIETVARAMDTAGRGQIVRAKNEANGDVYRVVITGANEGRVEPDKSDNVVALPQS